MGNRDRDLMNVPADGESRPFHRPSRRSGYLPQHTCSSRCHENEIGEAGGRTEKSIHAEAGWFAQDFTPAEVKRFRATEQLQERGHANVSKISS